jgi:hypothetical protein
VSWLEDLKTDDKVCVRVPTLGSEEYYIGVVSKVTKSRIEVYLFGHTSTFSRSEGKTKVSKWDIPNQLVEITPEVREIVARRRLASALEKRLSAIRVKELTFEQLQRLNSFLDTLRSELKEGQG